MRQDGTLGSWGSQRKKREEEKEDLRDSLRTSVLPNMVAYPIETEKEGESRANVLNSIADFFSVQKEEKPSSDKNNGDRKWAVVWKKEQGL